MIIHVGKCGGSNITYKFYDLYRIRLKTIHVRKPTARELQRADHICLLVRDPITRFISTFFYYFDMYQKDVSNEPVIHKRATKKIKHVFDKFKTPNELAESLNSQNADLKKVASEAFTIIPHLVWGFNRYMHADSIIKAIVENRHFVIRQEFYKEDFGPYYDYLIKKHKVKSNYQFFVESQRNNTSKYDDKKELSELAIGNLRTEFKNEYEALRKLCDYDLVSEEYLSSFL